MTNGLRGRARRALVALALLSGGVLASAPTALAQEEGIAGELINGTTGEPVPDTEVTLRQFGQQAEFEVRTTTTDRGGAFAFTDLEAGTTAYQVSATFAGVLYRSPVAPLSPGDPAKVTLRVFETTTDPAGISQTSWVIWVDREGEGAAIQYDLEWSNTGDEAYAGDQTLPGGTPIVTRVPLAAGATDFQFLGAFLETPGEVNGSTFVHPQPLVPGLTQATLRYSVPSLPRLSIPITMTTQSFQLFVPSDADARVSGLTPAGETTDQGVTYQVFAGTDLLNGDTIEVSLTGFTHGKSSSLTILLVGMAVLAAFSAIVMWRLLRRRQGRTRRRGSARRPARVRLAPARRRERPAEQAAAERLERSRVSARAELPASAHGNGGSSDGSEPPDEIDLLIDEIAALDLAYERGQLERHVYEDLRAATKERLLRSREAQAGGRSLR